MRSLSGVEFALDLVPGPGDDSNTYPTASPAATVPRPGFTPHQRTGRMFVAFLFVAVTAADDARNPLHPRIDKLIAAGYPDFAKHAAPPADDSEFLRRIYLDLTGTIPTAAEV